jgi:hypothetical protein
MKSLSYFILCLYLFFASVSPTSAASAKSPPVENDRILMGVAFSALNELHIIGADIDNDEHLRWAVWSQKSAQGMMVKLALLKNTATGPVVMYTLERKDAYEPDIKRIINWRYGKHPVLALTYHYGAAAEQVELYGLAYNNQPVRLDQRSGEVIGWGISSGGEALLGIYTKPEGRLKPTWYRWQEESHALVQTTNPAE